MSDVHAIILTFNEEQHIARCIQSLQGQCTSVTLIDSGSTDRTVEIARGLGAEVLVNPFVTHAAQVNFGINALVSRGGWLFRIDADEVLEPEPRRSLADHAARSGQGTNGFVVSRRIYFLGRRIRWGGIEPNWQLRLWRNGKGRCEDRWMDEHVQVDGTVEHSGIVISDINLNSVTWWTSKHNSYASREAIEILNDRHHFMPRHALWDGHLATQATSRRFLKEEVYGRVPRGLRALLYLVYRYLFRLGFLDGLPGWYFHVLQGFWYRTLVDAKVSEIENRARELNMPVAKAIHDRTGIDPLAVAHIPGNSDANIGASVAGAD
ncbi:MULTISPECIES: glycosyltransferase family 2 protein [unclassified Mesorhizobium]|uniref:glycosyltransferase family 2 protein n=1 Tax=unclassified Mesorhizobium TaxID=325217 RepID=UPI000FD56D55|nr:MULTISPECIES: glycosyltransferase family 2 protein [unclassified Mesorhizobium]RVB80567.1 glycosyltransferase family 2 protein [Mesorhizobium sp. M6A.T.Cr.TU.014.01.1.1]RWP97574.1 MAG: glycosyltransferase family 2 protein [Mesorhizobium sp.]RWQ10847.1 MAG: glycosyltransferase family 2 protein [Mesorhizobium sp.]